jgi:hypothetical protein
MFMLILDLFLLPPVQVSYLGRQFCQSIPTNVAHRSGSDTLGGAIRSILDTICAICFRTLLQRQMETPDN